MAGEVVRLHKGPEVSERRAHLSPDNLSEHIFKCCPVRQDITPLLCAQDTPPTLHRSREAFGSAAGTANKGGVVKTARGPFATYLRDCVCHDYYKFK